MPNPADDMVTDDGHRGWTKQWLVIGLLSAIGVTAGLALGLGMRSAPQFAQNPATLIANSAEWEGRPAFCSDHTEVLNRVVAAIKNDLQGGQSCNASVITSTFRGPIVSVECTKPPRPPETCSEIYSGEVWLERTKLGTADYQVLSKGWPQRRCKDGIFASDLANTRIKDVASQAVASCVRPAQN